MSRAARLIRDLPEGRRGQFLAVALLGLAILMLWVAVIAPLAGFFMQRAAHIDLNRETIARMTYLQDILPHLRRTASRLPDTAPGLIDGASDSIASATLQDHLAHLAATAGTEIGSSETLTPSTERGARRIGLHITLLAPYPAIVAFIGAVEQASPSMIIDGLHLHAPEDDNASGALSCDMSIFAFRRETAAIPTHQEPAP